MKGLFPFFLILSPTLTLTAQFQDLFETQKPSLPLSPIINSINWNVKGEKKKKKKKNSLLS